MPTRSQNRHKERRDLLRPGNALHVQRRENNALAKLLKALHIAGNIPNKMMADGCN
jgi:hypothetical protein